MATSEKGRYWKLDESQWSFHYQFGRGIRPRLRGSTIHINPELIVNLPSRTAGPSIALWRVVCTNNIVCLIVNQKFTHQGIFLERVEPALGTIPRWPGEVSAHEDLPDVRWLHHSGVMGEGIPVR